MAKNKIKNPLVRRIPRELRDDWRKYLVVGIFLIVMIGFVSGMFVANHSMLQTSEEGIEKYKREDGHFSLQSEITKEDDLWKALEDGKDVPVTLYKNYYKNTSEKKSNKKSDIRVFVKTKQINLADLMEGKWPKAEDEIAIDRMHADNADIQVGDTIQVNDKDFKVTGLISYVNYQTLHKKNTDMMFDALTFDVAMVTGEGFKRIDEATVYNYAWLYKAGHGKDDAQEKEWSEDFLDYLVEEVKKSNEGSNIANTITDFLPRYQNAAINFAAEDMGNDKAMGGVLLYILVVVIAFIFGITINATIEKESSVIGTLRASGYTKGELLRHYMAMPVLVTLIAAALGNILAYTFFKNVIFSMYYNSYSLPSLTTHYSMEGLIKTTLVPVILMFVINFFVISHSLRHSPLEFIRHDLKKSKRKKAMRLPRWNFFARFRLRVLFRNIPNYIVIFIGITFVAVLLSMAVGMPNTLSYYKNHVEELIFTKHQYVLTNYKTINMETGELECVETKTKGAEKFALTNLKYHSSGNHEETISLYGISSDSDYIRLPDLSDNEVVISKAFAEKYGVKEGDVIKLEEKYEKKSYKFQVVKIDEIGSSLAVYLGIREYRENLDLKDDYFTGYFSDKKIKDIDRSLIATVITKQEIVKMCNQLDHSMGNYMLYFQYVCIILSAILMYLLTKIIIEKSETSISMTKILGYSNQEIAALYIRPTTYFVVLADLLAIFIGGNLMKTAWRAVMLDMDGYFAFMLEPLSYLKMFLFIFLGYLLVMFVDFNRVKKIPLDEALKNVE